MKFKTEKRFISIALVICMLLSLCFVTNATGTTANELELATAEKIEQMVSVFYSGIPGDYEIGNAMTIYNADVESIYYVIPIFRDEECVGTAEVDSMGNVSLCDDTTLYANVSELSLPEYLLYTTGGRVYAENEETAVELYDSGFDCSGNTIFVSLTYAEKNVLINDFFESVSLDFDISATIEEIEPVNIVISEVSIRSNVLPVTSVKCNIRNFVSQGTHDLCWAACVATVVNFKWGKSLTAIDIARDMGQSYPYYGVDLDEIEDAFELHLLYYDYISGKPLWSSIKNYINNNKPFCAIMQGNNNEHMLVGYGYEYHTTDADQYSDFRGIYFWDPNGIQRMFQYNAAAYSMNGVSWTWINTFID